jgi:hypothetical protein
MVEAGERGSDETQEGLWDEVIAMQMREQTRNLLKGFTKSLCGPDDDARSSAIIFVK